MKKILIAFFATLAIFGSTAGANAAMLDFENIGTFHQIPDGYGSYAGFAGFSWIMPLSITMDKTVGIPGLLPYIGTTSGNNVALTNISSDSGDIGSTFALTSQDLFTFNSAYFTSLMLENNNILIEGYLDNVIQNTANFDVTSSALTYFDAKDKFTGINKLVIKSASRVSQDWITMDDLKYNEPSAPAPAPEPSSIILGLMGLGSALGYRRKKTA